MPLDPMILVTNPTLLLPLATVLSTIWVVVQVAVGLGLVIFVHELGHFLVAKACGVRCDRFFLGFDFWGWKIFSHKWGETEYGIGAFPLGGYVMMYGQADDPAKLDEAIESSKAQDHGPGAKRIVGPDGKERWVDRRSYIAKSVPQRIAIISAGVVMNAIFAVVFAWFAYGFGVPELKCVLGGTIPGGSAWRAGLRAGDRITRIGGIENPTYRQLQESVVLGDVDRGVELVVEREGESPRSLTLRPDTTGPLPLLGVQSGVALRVAADDRAVLPNTPAAVAGKKGKGFEPGDAILAIDGDEVATYAELSRRLLAKRDQPVTFQVLRGGTTSAADPFGPLSGGERVEVRVEPNPRERLGVVPTLGPIVAVEEGSPADRAGLVEGDRIVSVDGAPLGAAPDGQEAWDPVTLDDRLTMLAARGESVTLGVVRGGETDSPREVSIAPRVVDWPDDTVTNNSPVSIAALGVACELRPEVAAIVLGSPAAGVDLRPGDKITKARFADDEPNQGFPEDGREIDLTENRAGWALVLEAIQDPWPSTRVGLTVEREGKTHSVELRPEPAAGSFVYTRGVVLSPLKELRSAGSWGERATLAWDSTIASLTSVVRFLSKIGTQVPVTALGGPVTIARVAGQSAYEGIGALLMSLTMLSANLAVLNLLPIPVLDGGHLVFLAYEGVVGRPANSRVVGYLQTAGLYFLAGLMAFVFALDLGIIPRGL